MSLLHPILATRGRSGAYLVATLGLGALVALLLGRWAGLPAPASLALGLPLGVFLGFAALAVWYAVRSLPHPAAAPLRTAGVLGAAAALGTGIWLATGLVGARLLGQLGFAGDGVAALRATWPALVALGLLTHGVAMLLHYLLLALDRSREAERRMLEAATLAREAELAALRAQLAPHFLFNSLNSIAALAGRDAAGARRMCTLLAEFFRRSLTSGAAQRLPLAGELELARTYLAIEEIRFGDRLHVAWDLDEDLLAVQVPPLLLQPLVENAVHHGLAHCVEGGTLEVAVRGSMGDVVLTVVNPLDSGRPPSQGTGTGLANLRRRLHHHYGERARLAAGAEGMTFRCELRLPREWEPESP